MRHEHHLTRPEPDSYKGKTAPLWNYSVALDEIYRHRSELAIIAMELEALLDFKSMPKSVRLGIEETVKTLRTSAKAPEGRWYLQPDMVKAARERAFISQTMTRAQFELEKGLAHDLG